MMLALCHASEGFALYRFHSLHSLDHAQLWRFKDRDWSRLDGRLKGWTELVLKGLYMYTDCTACTGSELCTAAVL